MTSPPCSGARALRRAALAASAVALSACSGNHNVFDSDGTGSARIATIGAFMLITAAAVGALFLGALVWGLARRRRPSTVGIRAERGFIVAGGVLLPVAVIASLTVLSLNALNDPAHHTVHIEVTGHQFWWEVRYPDAGIVTANELHVPVGKPVEVTLRSADVVHTFWVPSLAPKLDMVPGHVNHLTIEAKRTGTFRGQCAEYCGLAHALMIFYVHVDTAADYRSWVEHESAPAASPSTAAERDGQEAFIDLPCASCHAIRGTSADGDDGPDLTHFASRMSIGAGAVPNTPGNLAGWMPNSHTIKPGSLMPPVPMSPEQLHALLAYMRSLR
jgi:cytochrome c oxidase subunit 2